MHPVTPAEHVTGRAVAVGPGLVDVVLAGEGPEVAALVSLLALATEHRFRLEVHGTGPLAGARGHITSDFEVSADGAVAAHEVVLSIHRSGGGPA